MSPSKIGENPALENVSYHVTQEIGTSKLILLIWASRQVGKRAFTILEMLVAMAITLVVVTLLLSITSGMMSRFEKTSSSVENNGKARLLLDLIAQDLRSAVIRRNGEVWFAADILGNADNSGVWEKAPGQKPRGAISIELSPKPNAATEQIDYEKYRFGQGGVWLRFFTSALDRNRSGFTEASSTAEKVDDVKEEIFNDSGKLPLEDQEQKSPTDERRRFHQGQHGTMTAVSYQLIRRGIMDGDSPHYHLFRSVVRTDETFKAGFDITRYRGKITTNGKKESEDPFDIFEESDSKEVPNFDKPKPERSDSEDTTPDDASEIVTPSPYNVVAGDVIDFGIILKQRNSSGELVEAFPNRHPTLPLVADPFRYRSPTHGVPEVAVVVVRTLSKQGAGIINAIESGDPNPQRWWDLAIQYSEVHTRTVYLNHAL